jgi:hypothetical protein
MRENAGGEEASSTAVAMDARASAVLTLRGKSGSDDASAGGGGGGGVPATTSIRLSEEDCLKLQNSMDEMATRVKEAMEKYGEGEKGGE